MEIIEFINADIFGPTIPLLLFAAGLYIMTQLGAKPFSHLLSGMSGAKKSARKRGKKRVSPFAALTVALAGTLGVGNIVGVAGALMLGGPGALFWMWVSAIFASAVKYAEVVLALRYRQSRDGHFFGGAMYYLERLSVPLARAFAVMLLVNAFSTGGILQINPVSSALSDVLGINPAATGGICAVAVFLICRRRENNIAGVTKIIIPAATVCYTLMSAAAIISNASALPAVAASVFSGAFSPSAAGAGIGGFLFSRALRYGTMRGLLSNEAGCGTAPTAHAGADTDDPVRQGFFGVLEVLCDTLLLCSLTAFVILLCAGSELESASDPMALVIAAYGNGCGGFARTAISLLTAVFAFATMLCYCFYGRESLTYLTRSRAAQRIFVLVYCALLFAGAFISSSAVFGIADLVIGAMTAVNTVCVCLLIKEVRAG